MAAQKSTSRGRQSASSQKIQWKKGAALAVEMLKGFEGSSEIPTCFARRRRDMGPKQNLVEPYLKRLTNPQMTEGFSAILSLTLAMHQHVGHPHFEWLELHARLPWGQAEMVWDMRTSIKQQKATTQEAGSAA